MQDKSQALREIQSLLKANATPEGIAAAQKFVPGSEKVYGARMPYLNLLATKYKNMGFELVETIWKAGAFEEKILAAKLLGKMAKKDPDRSVKLVELFSKDIGNWAVCDTIGTQSLKPLVKTEQDKIFTLARKLNGSREPWQRRLSLVLVEWYTRERKLHPEIKRLVKHLEKDDDYYVRKAVAWITKNLNKGK